MSRIAAIIFDRDGTLVRLDVDLVRQLQAEERALIPTLPVGATNAHWINWPGPWPDTVADEPAFWRQYWDAFAQHHALAAADIDLLRPFGTRYHTVFRAYPDTLPCLQHLRQHYPQIKLAVLTNFQLPSVHVTLQHAGIAPDYFDLLLSSSMLGVEKPAKAAYQYTCDRLGVKPSACVFVDDLPIHVTGASVLGMRSILIDRDNTYPTWSGERIRNLYELSPLLAEGTNT